MNDVLTDDRWSQIIRTVREERPDPGFQISKQEMEIILREGREDERERTKLTLKRLAEKFWAEYEGAGNFTTRTMAAHKAKGVHAALAAHDDSQRQPEDERESTEEAPDLTKALALLALTAPGDDFPLDGLFADPFEAEGLVVTGIEYCGEGYCHLTKEGTQFVSRVLAASFTPATQSEQSHTEEGLKMAENEIKLRFANSILRVSEGDEEILLEHEVPGGPHTIAYLAPDEIHQLVVALYGDDYATNQQPSYRDEEVREKAQALLNALDTAEQLAAGGEAQEANVNRVLTAAARGLRAALAATSGGER